MQSTKGTWLSAHEAHVHFGCSWERTHEILRTLESRCHPELNRPVFFVPHSEIGVTQAEAGKGMAGKGNTGKGGKGGGKS